MGALLLPKTSREATATLLSADATALRGKFPPGGWASARSEAIWAPSVGIVALLRHSELALIRHLHGRHEAFDRVVYRSLDACCASPGKRADSSFLSVTHLNSTRSDPAPPDLYDVTDGTGVAGPRAP